MEAHIIKSKGMIFYQYIRMGLLNCILFNSIQLLLSLPLFLSLPIHTMLYPDFFLEHFFLLHLTQGHSQLTHATLQLGFETPAPQSLSAPHLLQHSLSRCFIFPPKIFQRHPTTLTSLMSNLFSLNDKYP